MIKRIICLLLAVGTIVAAIVSCSSGQNSTEWEGKPAEYCFEASLKVNKKVVKKDEVINLTSEKLEGKLSISNENKSNVMSIVMFSNGEPIEFQIGGVGYTYYTFEATKKTNINYAVNSDQFPAGESSYDVVFLMQESLELLYSRDDEKNYSFSISCKVNNNSSMYRESTDIIDVDSIYCTYDDYYNACYRLKKQNNALDKGHDYEAEKIKLYDMVSAQELDICFANAIEDDKPSDMSVVRNTVSNIQNSKKVQLRICGQPGEYMLTMFDHTGLYAGFDGVKTVRVTVKENCFTYIEVDCPPYTNQGISCTYALAVSCDNSERRVFDSGLLNVYYAENDIDLSYNYSERRLSLYYENELINSNIEDQIFTYNGGKIEFRFLFGEQSSSYISDYWLLVLIDGLIQKIQVNDQDGIYMYKLDSTNMSDITVELTPQFNEQVDTFSVSCVVVPATFSNPIAPTSFSGIESAMQSEIRFQTQATSDNASDEFLGLENRNEDEADSNEKCVIKMYGDTVGQSNITELKSGRDGQIGVQIIGGDKASKGNSCLVVNGRVVMYDNQPLVSWMCEPREMKDIQYIIPMNYLHSGINEAYYVTQTDNQCVLNRYIILVYGSSSDNIDLTLNTEKGTVQFDGDRLDPSTIVRVYCSTTSDPGYFGNLLNCVTSRHLWSSLQGEAMCEYGEEFSLLSTIVSTESYADGVYSFARRKTLVRLL